MTEMPRMESAESSLATLEKPLEQISDRKFREVIGLLEKARELPGVKRVLEQIRPRLRRVRPPRPRTLRRLFYVPAEDVLMLENGVGLPGQVSREAIALAWSYVQQQGDAAQWLALQNDFDAVEGDEAAELAIGKRLWVWTGALLAAGLKTAGADRQVRRDLIGDRSELFPEMEAIAVLLRFGAAVENMKSLLPLKPIRVITPDHLLVIRELIQNNSGGNPHTAFVLAMAAAARMAVPADLVRHISQMQTGLSRGNQLSLTEQLQSVTLAAMDQAAARIERARDGDPLDRADAVRELVLAVAAAQQGFKVEGQAKRDLARLKASAEQAVVEIVVDAGQRVTSAIEGGPAAPLDDQVKAENNLLALRKCGSFAASVGLDGKVNEVLSRVALTFRQRSTVLLNGLANPTITPAALDGQAAGIEEQIYWVVRMLELAGNADEADKVRRTGMGLLRQQRRPR